MMLKMGLFCIMAGVGRERTGNCLLNFENNEVVNFTGHKFTEKSSGRKSRAAQTGPTRPGLSNLQPQQVFVF